MTDNDQEWEDYVSELSRAMKETGNDSNRCFSVIAIGDADGMIDTIQVDRGQADQIRKEWEFQVQGVSQETLDTQQRILADCEAGEERAEWEADFNFENGESLGRQARLAVLENCFFVFPEDCGPCDPPLEKKTAGPPLDEWNALHNLFPENPACKAIWDKRKLTYTQAYDKVASMVVLPPPPDQKYHWYDRTI